MPVFHASEARNGLLVASAARISCDLVPEFPWLYNRNRRLSRSTADASPGRLLTLLKWKCKREGVRLVEVDRFYPSSKTCSACGVV